MESSIFNTAIDKELRHLLTLIGEDEIIIRYKELEKRIKENKKLTTLVEEIKKAQKDVVQYAHYEKPEAEKEAIARTNALTKEFDEHPLVIAYREQLIEANDLLQYITDKIQYRINDELEKGGEQ